MTTRAQNWINGLEIQRPLAVAAGCGIVRVCPETDPAAGEVRGAIGAAATTCDGWICCIVGPGGRVYEPVAPSPEEELLVQVQALAATGFAFSPEARALARQIADGG
jgi:hypothetical protein